MHKMSHCHLVPISDWQRHFGVQIIYILKLDFKCAGRKNPLKIIYLFKWSPLNWFIELHAAIYIERVNVDIFHVYECLFLTGSSSRTPNSVFMHMSTFVSIVSLSLVNPLESMNACYLLGMRWYIC